MVVNRPLSVSFFLLLSSGAAEAADVTGEIYSSTVPTYSLDGNELVYLDPITHILSSSFNTSLFSAGTAFSNTSVQVASPSPGQFTVTNYQGFSAPFNGGGSSGVLGAQLNVTYQKDSSASVTPNQNWIQIYKSSDPGTDHLPQNVQIVDHPDIGEPFYYAPGETDYPTGPNNDQGKIRTQNMLNFYDQSVRVASDIYNPKRVDPSGNVTWTAQLYQADMNAAGGVTVHDGLQWGWTIESATKGVTTGTFSNPSPGCPPKNCFGLGTNSFYYGIGYSPEDPERFFALANNLSFKSVAVQPQVGVPFSLGTLSLHSINPDFGTAPTSVDLDLGLNLTNDPTKSPSLDTKLLLGTALDVDNPAKSSDYAQFDFGGSSHVIAAYNGKTESASLIGEIVAHDIVPVSSDPLPPANGSFSSEDTPTFDISPDDVSYSLELLGFADPSSGGYVSGGDSIIVPTVAEPSSIMILTAPIVVFGCFGLRRKLVDRALS